jgi:hypothetical protein
MPNKKLNPKTFKELTQENQQKVVLYLLGALILIMIGISGISSGTAGLVLAAIGIPLGSWLGYTGYNILLDPKNEKKCNAAYWTVTQNVGFDTDNYDENDMGITLCKAQIKAQYYGGYTGFFCTSNIETEDTIDAYYFTTKKLTIKTSGTANVFTAKSTVKITDPPGSFKVEFVGSPSTTVTIRGSSFIRIDETKNVSVTVTTTEDASSPVMTTSSHTIQQLKDGIVLQRGSVFSVTAYSTTRDGIAVTKSLTIR